MRKRTSDLITKRSGMLQAWSLSLTMLALTCFVRAGDDDTTTATKTGGITVYNDKRGTDEADIKAGPITKSAITPRNSQEETLTTATRIGNVTELTGSKGTKSTVVTVGPMTGGQVNGKSISVTRIGENVALGSDGSGGTMNALKVGNQVLVKKSENVSASEVRIIVRLLQEPVAGQAPNDVASEVALLPFTGVDVAGDIVVDVEVGQPFEIAVSDKKSRESTSFSVEEGVLRVRCARTGLAERGAARRIVVRLPALTDVTATDGAQVVARNVTGERCLVVSRGGGKVELSGKVDTAQYRASGGGRVLGQNLRTGRMSVRLDGDDGEVHCRADQELVVIIAGKGVVWCHGQPGLVTRKIDGGGELKFDKQ